MWNMCHQQRDSSCSNSALAAPNKSANKTPIRPIEISSAVRSTGHQVYPGLHARMRVKVANGAAVQKQAPRWHNRAGDPGTGSGGVDEWEKMMTTGQSMCSTCMCN